MFSPSNCTNSDIWEEFPRLTGVGAGPFGEDPDLFGDTLDEVIIEAPRGNNLKYNLEAIQELRKLLSFTDEELDRITRTWVLLSIDPTADDTRSTFKGRYPDFRTFWEAVLRSFENDPDVREHTGT